MTRLMVQYRVRADETGANVRAIEGVFAQLAERQPPGMSYASFKLDDDVSFVHIFSAETNAEREALRALPAFQEFSTAIRDRCDQLPVVTPLNEIGSYRMFGSSAGK